MRSTFRKSPIALVALFIALGSSGAVAATKIGSNQIAPDAIKAKHLKSNSVGSPDLKPAEAWRIVGTEGQPPFSSNPSASWDHFDHVHNEAAFYRDPYGVVHIKGLVRCTGDGCAGSEGDEIFSLPPGYRPSHREVLLAIANNGTTTGPARVNIDPSGLVTTTEIGGRKWLSLDGITFRAP